MSAKRSVPDRTSFKRCLYKPPPPPPLALTVIMLMISNNNSVIVCVRNIRCGGVVVRDWRS